MARRSHALAAKNSTKKLSILRVQSCCRHSQFCRLKAQVTQSEWTARPYPPCKPPGLSASLLQIFSTICQSKAWFPYDRYDCCDRWEKQVQRSQRQQSLRQNTFYLSERCRCDPRCDRWRVVSIWSLWSPRSLNLFSSAIAAIIWKPRLRDRNTYTTLTDDLSLDKKMHVIPIRVGC